MNTGKLYPKYIRVWNPGDELLRILVDSGTMQQPQSVILPQPARHSLFVTARTSGQAADVAALATACASLPRILEEVSEPGARVNGAASFGQSAWQRLAPGAQPGGLRTFRPIEGKTLSAPATGGDVFFHVNSGRVDLNYEALRRIIRPLAGLLEITEETPCSEYLDSRDLTGFIDGTENPEGDRARAATALIDDGEFAGGSFVFTQRYRHHLEPWSRLDVKEQEKIIGRTKPDSVELPDDEKPATAHIRRVVIEENGEELEIVRHSMAYHSLAGESGLFFAAYTKDLDIIDKMLARMYGQTGDGLHDRLMDYTTPVSGAMFFTPSLQVLERFAR